MYIANGTYVRIRKSLSKDILLKFLYLANAYVYVAIYVVYN